MKKLFIRLGPVGALVLLIVAGAALSPQTANSKSPVGSPILAHKLAVELGKAKPIGKEMPVSEGVMYTLMQATGVLDKRAERWSHTAAGQAAMRQAANESGLSDPKTEGCQNTFQGHGMKNVRVNQDCSFRRQAEEMIQINPLDESNIIVGQNDSRIGFNHCGYDWTFDGGKRWGDQLPPFWQFVQLDNHTPDACSDPTGAWDSSGNAYVGGVLFDVASGANSVLVMKSNAGNGGAFYHSPRVQPFQEYRDTPVGVVANDDGTVFDNDKELMTADSNASSPKHDNVYMTWTRFTADNHSPIYFSQSTDGGDHWSTPVEISGSNAAICTPGPACNDDQGSHPTVGPDGTIYVTFGNEDIPGAGILQALFVKCPVAADCRNAANWTTPVRIDSLTDNLPTGPNASTGCPGGRHCIPPNGYRVTEFTGISNSVDANGKLYAVWTDFRNNTNPSCTGPASTATPPCDNDVFYAFSTNGGATWSAPRNVTPRSRFGENAQWQPWSEVSSDGSRLWVAYYDRQYGNCEFTGCNDITATEIVNPASGSPTYIDHRVTTASMPNLVVANNPLQAGFLGDYMWVDTDSHGDAHIVWADTRPIRGTFPEEDVYYAKVPPTTGTR